VASSLTSIYVRKNCKLDRRIELNWNNYEDFHRGDFVALFDFDVSNLRDVKVEELESAAKECIGVTESSGSYLTSTRWEKKDLNFKQDPFLGYWIAYIGERNGSLQVLQTNSLRLWPTWMNDMKKCIGDIPLHSLMIPGTHDSGSWRPYEASSCENIYVRYYIW